ncbi:MAG: stage III sporulation protein AD [Clostridia bacterium]|nr:stage III sporulation protein AD [Clostridia bacterium]
MEILKIIGVGLITVVATVLVKQTKPEIAICVGLAGGIIIITMVIDYGFEIINTFSSIVEKTGLGGGIFKTVLKIVGIGYLTEFSAGICADSGNGSIGDKILLAGKILILVYSLPIVTSIIEILVGILP